eukprot:TRINITY_DN10355_c0_g1_i1.p2 TRINITY_DN10355_c0_g1~~TRINITY_DN10355_c0_g1_i1.p2  ORF type:complete len:67 (-),score=1.06 TRINITY_DN10355_c0_g1_i1:56-256(-)
MNTWFYQVHLTRRHPTKNLQGKNVTSVATAKNYVPGSTFLRDIQTAVLTSINTGVVQEHDFRERSS